MYQDWAPGLLAGAPAGRGGGAALRAVAGEPGQREVWRGL